VQPDTVCKVGGSTPDLSYGDLGILPGGGQTEEIIHHPRSNRCTGDAPSIQPEVARVLPQRNVGLEVSLSLSQEMLECPHLPLPMPLSMILTRMWGASQGLSAFSMRGCAFPAPPPLRSLAAPSLPLPSPGYSCPPSFSRFLPGQWQAQGFAAPCFCDHFAGLHDSTAVPQIQEEAFVEHVKSTILLDRNLAVIKPLQMFICGRT